MDRCIDMPMSTNRVCCLLISSLFAVSLNAAGTVAPAQYGPFGLDLTAQNNPVKPGDDFCRYANGHWADTHQIPADRTRWGTLDELTEQADDKVRKLIQSLPEHAVPGSIEQKVGDY